MLWSGGSSCLGEACGLAKGQVIGRGPGTGRILPKHRELIEHDLINSIIQDLDLMIKNLIWSKAPELDFHKYSILGLYSNYLKSGDGSIPTQSTTVPNSDGVNIHELFCCEHEDTRVLAHTQMGFACRFAFVFVFFYSPIFLISKQH